MRNSCFQQAISELQSLFMIKGKESESSDLGIDRSKFKQEIFKCKNNFYGNVERGILLAKIKISDSIANFKKVIEQRQPTKLQINCIRLIKPKLSVLNCDIQNLLKQGLLSTYLQLFQFKVKLQKTNDSGSFCQFLTACLGSFPVLLRFFFVYKQYQNNAPQDIRHHKEKSTLSLRNLNLVKKVDTEINNAEDIILKEIEQKLSSSSIQDLLENYLKYKLVNFRNQEKNIEESMEICRICEGKVKISEIQIHVRICQKKSILKQDLDNIFIQMENQIHYLRIIHANLIKKEQKNQEEQDFLKVLKIIFCVEKKRQRNIFRRASLIGVKSQKDIDHIAQIAIEDYIEEHCFEKSRLKKILELSREKVMTEKKINFIEMQSLNHGQNQLENDSFSSYAADSVHLQKSKNARGSAELSNEKIYLTNGSTLVIEDFTINSGKDISRQSIDSKSSKKSDEDQIFINQSLKALELPSFKTKKSVISKTKILQELDFDDFQHNHSFRSLQLVPSESINEKIISLQQFAILKFIGAGAFGKVYLAKRLETNDLYALKIVKMSQKCDENQIATIKNQHQIFKKIAGDHLVRAPFSFSQKSSHIFILQYLPGGDLGKLLATQVYFDQQKAKFYLAEIILAIEHLHKFNIIHRDLKPQNLVFDKNGHLKLTDFGLSEIQINNKLRKVIDCQKELAEKKKNRKRRTGVTGIQTGTKLIGTPDYIAPQIINQLSTSNFTIDWWSLGVMAYELLTGARPFSGETIEEVINNISTFNIQWPQIGYEEGMISPEAKDFIQKLLNKDFVNRFGSKGAQQLKQHPFFQGLDWERIKFSKPPIVPNIDCIKKYETAIQDINLRKQIMQIISEKTTKNSKKSKYQMQRFVRFDILGSQTIENVEKIYEKKKEILNRLQSLNFQEDKSMKLNREQ